MRNRGWGWILLVTASLLVLAGAFVISFIDEPSAVGRMEAALIVVGAALIVAGLAGGVAGVWMLIIRRT